jgi:hypothetical protein
MGQRVKNRPTLVTTQPVVQLAWLGLGGKKAPRCKRGGDEDAKVTCEGGREERERERARARAREKEGERQRGRLREKASFPLECSTSFIIAIPTLFTISTVVCCSTCLV